MHGICTYIDTTRDANIKHTAVGVVAVILFLLIQACSLIVLFGDTPLHDKQVSAIKAGMTLMTVGLTLGVGIGWAVCIHVLSARGQQRKNRHVTEIIKTIRLQKRVPPQFKIRHCGGELEIMEPFHLRLSGVDRDRLEDALQELKVDRAIQQATAEWLEEVSAKHQ